MGSHPSILPLWLRLMALLVGVGVMGSHAACFTHCHLPGAWGSVHCGSQTSGGTSGCCRVMPEIDPASGGSLPPTPQVPCPSLKTWLAGESAVVAEVALAGGPGVHPHPIPRMEMTALSIPCALATSPGIPREPRPVPALALGLDCRTLAPPPVFFPTRC